MAARREITRKYAKECVAAGRKDKGRMLDELVAVTGWSRANTRRAIATAGRRKGRRERWSAGRDCPEFS